MTKDEMIAAVTALRLARDEIAKRRRALERERKRLRAQPKQDARTDWIVDRLIGDQRGMKSAERVLDKRIERLLRVDVEQ